MGISKKMYLVVKFALRVDRYRLSKRIHPKQYRPFLSEHPLLLKIAALFWMDEMNHQSIGENDIKIILFIEKIKN